MVLRHSLLKTRATVNRFREIYSLFLETLLQAHTCVTRRVADAAHIAAHDPDNASRDVSVLTIKPGTHERAVTVTVTKIIMCTWLASLLQAERAAFPAGRHLSVFLRTRKASWTSRVKVVARCKPTSFLEYFTRISLKLLDR